MVEQLTWHDVIGMKKKKTILNIFCNMSPTNVIVVKLFIPRSKTCL